MYEMVDHAGGRARVTQKSRDDEAEGTPMRLRRALLLDGAGRRRHAPGAWKEQHQHADTDREPHACHRQKESPPEHVGHRVSPCSLAAVSTTVSSATTNSRSGCLTVSTGHGAERTTR